MSVAAFDIAGAQWRSVSPALIKIRYIVASLWYGIFLLGSLALAIFVTKWLWIGVGVFLIVAMWTFWLIPRQVRALQYAELADELAIRKGIVFQQLTLIPYGRLQFVDMEAGPLPRKYGVAQITLKTASTQTDAAIPGVPAAEAAVLRDRLIERGEAQLAGL